MIEQPKNDYKAYSKQVEVSSDEFAHVVEIYNFPSEFKTSDLAAVFSSFKNGGFELKWVDDTHCLGVFSSPLVGMYIYCTYLIIYIYEYENIIYNMYVFTDNSLRVIFHLCVFVV